MAWIVACLLPLGFFAFGYLIANDGLVEKIDREVREENEKEAHSH